MAIQYAPLFALETQFQTKDGRNNTGGWLKVFLAATDDPATTYSDYNGTRNPEKIVLDDDGRALVICDKSKAYRLEVYDINGMLLWTEEPVFCSGTGGGGVSSSTDIISTDGTIVVEKSTSGSSTTFDIGLGVDKDRLNPSCLSADATPRNSDGKFVFGELYKEGDLLSVDNYGCVRCEPACYHFTAIVELSYDQVAKNSSHQITLYTTLSNSVVDFDLSYAHRESIELSGDIYVVESNSEFVLGVTGLPNGVVASLVDFDIHAITGHGQSTKYSAGNGINIAGHVISADLDVVQHKLTAGENISITGNVISAGNFSQAQADWTEEDTGSPAYIRNKPNLGVYATKEEVNTGLSGKQDTINDLAQIRAGAASGSSAVQASDLAVVATTGDYNSLNNRPNLTVYATKTEVNTGLAAKQDVISDLSAIREGAQAGATAVQPADLNAYATDAELTAGLATKQDVLTPGDNITISNNVISATGQRQADWEQSDSSAVDYIRNKPDLSAYATDAELTAGLATKQDTINDLSEIRAGAAAGATALQHSDVATVATTGDYADLTNKPSIPTKTSDLTNDSGFITLSDVPAQVKADWNESDSSNPSYIDNKPDLSVYATTSAMNTALATKQDTLTAGTGIYIDENNVISSSGSGSCNTFNAVYGVTTLSEIVDAVNSGYAVFVSGIPDEPGMTLPLVVFRPNLESADFYVYSGTAMYVVGLSPTGKWGYYAYRAQADWNETRSSFPSYIYNKPTIPSGTQLVPAATSADADKVLTVDAQGTPAWASAKAPISAGTGIDITNNVVSVDTSVVATQTDLASKQDTISDLATIRSGAAEGATAVQPGDLATVATSGSYNDLSDKPSIPAAQVNSDWNASSGVAEILNKPQLSTVATTGDYDDLVNKPSIPAAQVNSDWNAVSGVSEILNKPTIPSGNQLVPAATSADADKVLTVNAQGTPAWASAQAPISAGDGIDITNNVVSTKVDGTTVTFNASGELQAAAAVTVDQTYNAASTNAQSGTAVAQAVATKEDVFDVGTGLEMDTSGATPTLQVEAPVDIVAGPGIVIDNPDGNTLRVSQRYPTDETVLWTGTKCWWNDTSNLQLSEAASHFETIRVKAKDDWALPHTFIFFPGDNTSFDVSLIGYEGGSLTIKTSHFNLSGTTVSMSEKITFSVGSDNKVTTNTATSFVQFSEIVGIHRIANN